MRGNPVPLVEAFHCGFSVAHIDLLPDHPVGNAVEMPFHLDVVVDVYPGNLPLGILVRDFRQRQHCRFVQLLETSPPGAGEFPEGTVVQEFQPFFDGGIRLGQSEEGVMPQTGQDEPLHELDSGFNLGFVSWLADAGGNDGSTVMGRQFQIGGIDAGFVAAGSGDTGEQVVRDNAQGHGTEVGERPNVGAGPVGKRLGPGGFGEGEVAGTHYCDKHLSVTYLAGGLVNDGECLAAVVYEHLLTGTVLLAHGEV